MMRAVAELTLRGQQFSALVFGAQSDPTPPPGRNSTGAEFGKAAPIGLVIVLLLLIGVILLIRSMNRHVRAIPSSFDDPGSAPTDRGT